MEKNSTVRNIGETIVAQWLAEKGYVTNISTKPSCGSGILAKGPVRSLVILVTPLVRSEESMFHSYEDLRNVKAMALWNNCDPYEALVQLDENFQLVGRIQLKRL